jgi:hypothetical protein
VYGLEEIDDLRFAVRRKNRRLDTRSSEMGVRRASNSLDVRRVALGQRGAKLSLDNSASNLERRKSQATNARPYSAGA